LGLVGLAAQAAFDRFHHPQSNGIDGGHAAAGVAQGGLKGAFEFANFENGDAAARGPQAVAVEQGIGAKGLGQALIESAGGAMQRWDQSGPDSFGSVGVVVDLKGVATGRNVGLTHAPVGAGIIAVDDRAQGGVVEADRQAPLLAQTHHRLGGEQVPMELIANPGLHRLGTAEIYGGT